MATVGDNVKAENLQGVLAVEGEEEQGEEFKALDEQEEEAEMPLCLPAVRDSRSKAVFAHVIPSKGIDEKGFSVSS